MNTVAPKQKTCKECDITADSSEFVKNRRVCKRCYGLRSKRWRKNNHSRSNMNARKWVRKNKEKAKLIYNRSCQKNHEKYRAKYMRANSKWRTNLPGKLLSQAKIRARKYNLPFNLTLSDIVVPERCPVLGLKLEIGIGHSHSASPSLDRIIPEQGYVKGNVVVVSHRANTIKSDATIMELEKVLNFYKSLMKEVSN